MNIVAIQIMRRRLGLSEARYRDLLNRIGGVNSSKDLTQPAARKVYGALRRMAVAATPAARYVWVLWNQLQPYLPPADRHGACRTPDGMAHRMDRLEALGNGQVPAVAALAWEILSGAFRS